jgi:hypothetical protein
MTVMLGIIISSDIFYSHELCGLGQWLTTGWTVWRLDPGGVRFSATIQTNPQAQPASHLMGTGSFPGVKQPGHGIDHSPLSSTEIQETVELYLCSPLGPNGLF